MQPVTMTTIHKLVGLPRGETIQLFENADKTTYKQAVHTLDAAKLMQGKNYIDLCAGIIQYLWRDLTQGCIFCFEIISPSSP